MNEETHIDHLRNAVTSLSRRGLLKQGWLLGLGAWGIASGFGELVPTAGAAGTQLSGSQIPQRSPQRSRKTATELFTVLQGHPGGKEALEAAQKGKSRLSIGRLPSQIIRIPPFSVVLYPGHLKEGANAVALLDVDVLNDMSFELKPGSNKPSKVFLKIAFPRPGWYLLNIEGAQMPNLGISAKIREKRDGHLSGPVVQTWNYPINSSNKPVVRSFPAVYEFKDSPYSKFGLEFFLEGGKLLFQEVSVEAL